MAQRRLPKGTFEHVDKGTEDGISLEENRAAFHRIKLHKHFLNDWAKCDLSTEIFGQRINLPFGIAPTGSAGLMWYQGEVELAKAAAAAGIPFTLAMGALASMEEVTKILSDEMERTFGYVGVRKVSDMFARHNPGKCPVEILAWLLKPGN